MNGHIREELDKWYDWLPDTPINRIGGNLAVEWDLVARQVQEHTLRIKLAGPGVPHASGDA